MSDEDRQREARISAYLYKLSKAETLYTKKHWFGLMTEEINKRSPEQIERMERSIK